MSRSQLMSHNGEGIAESQEECVMGATQWKKVHLYQCPCGYKYDPEKGDPQAGWDAGTSFDRLPDQCTCPRCQRAKVHFREKKFSEPVSSP